MYIVDVAIKGIVPLIQHRFADEKATDEPVLKSGKRDFSGEAELALYRSPDGVIYQPSTHIEGALLKASSNFQIGGRGKKTYKDLTKSALIVSPDAIPHLVVAWSIDRRPVIVNRARIMRERPIFPDWALEFQIQVADPQLPAKVLNQMLIFAGQYVGIGDFRPKYGRFMVTKFEETPAEG